MKKKSRYYVKDFNQEAKKNDGKRKMEKKSLNAAFDRKLKNFQQRERLSLVNDDYQNRIGWGLKYKKGKEEILDPDWEEPTF